MAAVRRSSGGFWIAALLAGGTTLAVVLLIQTAMNYRYVSDSLIRQEGRQVADDTVRIVERSARIGRLENVQSAATLLDELRSEREDYLAWMVLRQGDGAVIASAGDPGSPLPRRSARRGSTDQDLDRDQSLNGRELLVGAFPCRCEVGERGVNSRAGRGGPAFASLENRLISGRLVGSLCAPPAQCPRQHRGGPDPACFTGTHRPALWRVHPGKAARGTNQCARQVQLDLLPRAGSPPAGVDVAAECLPAARVGGDFFDIVSLPSERYAFLVGDVSGHGISAALLMGLIHGAMSGPHWGVAADEASRAAQLNPLLVTKSSEERFASLFWCAFDPAAASLRYINAGHPPPLWIRRRDHMPAKIDRLTAGGPVLGVPDAASYSVEQITAAPGDVLVLFSDGVVEATSEAGEFFGDDRVVDVVRQSAEATPRAMVDTIFSALRTFTGGRPAEDDQTLLIVRRPPPRLRASDLE